MDGGNEQRVAIKLCFKAYVSAAAQKPVYKAMELVLLEKSCVSFVCHRFKKTVLKLTDRTVQIMLVLFNFNVYFII
jgi:hypothetical protein